MKSALLVIDVQEGLFGPQPRPFESETVIQKINQLALHAQSSGCPVIYVQHERPNSPLSVGSPGWMLASGLVPVATALYVRKTTPDSFLRTDLNDLLLAKNVGRVVVAGYASEFCVDTTVRKAASLGYEVVLVSDAHTTHDKKHLPAAAIREHENETLPGITSFGPKIESRPATSIKFSD